MKLDWIQPLLGQNPPFVTLYIDITGVGETAGREIANRWRSLRRELERDGAPTQVLEQLEEAVTRTPSRSGAQGRLLIANSGGVHVDRELAAAPTPSQAVFDADPALLPDAISADTGVDHLIVTADRVGADLVRIGTDLGKPEIRTTVDGDQDDITRTKGPQMLQGRIDHRAQDSWDRNAVIVAAELDRIVQQDAPEVILLTGDVRAVKLIRQSAGPKTDDLIVETQGGSRSAGVNEAAFATQLERTLDEFRAHRLLRTLEQLQGAIGRGSGAVSSLESVIEVLRRGQVSEIVLLESALANEVPARRPLWIGREPLQLALNEQELIDLGVEDRRQMQALVAVVRAAVGQNAGVSFVPNTIDLTDHIGALLRWDDRDTPRESAPSLSSDPARIRGNS